LRFEHHEALRGPRSRDAVPQGREPTLPSSLVIAIKNLPPIPRHHRRMPTAQRIDVVRENPMAIVVTGAFEWDERKAVANREKHHVTFEEAVTVFSDPQAIEAPDKHEKNRFVTIGYSRFSRILFVVFVEKNEHGKLRIISARRASRTQRRIYEEGS